jgi:hypothetical protein
VSLGSLLLITKVLIECLMCQMSNFMCLLCVTIVFLERKLYLMWVHFILGWGTQKECLTPISLSKHYFEWPLHLYIKNYITRVLGFANDSSWSTSLFLLMDMSILTQNKYFWPITLTKMIYLINTSSQVRQP